MSDANQARTSSYHFTPLSASAEDMRALRVQVEALDRRVRDLEMERDRQRDDALELRERAP
jgi:polyhydroxyalkanoate synthesis regulator phasin